MNIIEHSDIVAALRAAGIGRGDLVYLQTDLRTIGLIRGARNSEAACAAYLAAVREAIGAEGTILVPTFTTQVARYDIDFVWEETPTILGAFPEYLRRRAPSLRSLHPLHSMTALGPLQEELCGNNGPHDFGWNSPIHRAFERGAKTLVIGLESSFALGTTHQAEVMAGVPYFYNKLLKWVPVVNGRPVDRRYVAAVRYLNLTVAYDYPKALRLARSRGLVRSARLGGGWVHAGDYPAIVALLLEHLRQDHYWLLRQPPEFEYGVLPFDGPTAGRDGIASGVTVTGAGDMNWSGFYFDRGKLGGDEADLEAAERTAAGRTADDS